MKISLVRLLAICPQYFFIPENTARRIIPLRGFPRVEWAHGNPWPGGKGKT